VFLAVQRAHVQWYVTQLGAILRSSFVSVWMIVNSKPSYNLAIIMCLCRLYDGRGSLGPAAGGLPQRHSRRYAGQHGSAGVCIIPTNQRCNGGLRCTVLKDLFFLRNKMCSICINQVPVSCAYPILIT
jgi:hypothetical protein